MSGPAAPPRAPRQPLIILLPQWRRKEGAKSTKELRQRMTVCLQEMQQLPAGREALAQVRPILVVGRLPRQWWGALTWRPFILVNPVVLNDPATAVNALGHEYGHCLFQTSLGSRIVDSLEQERSAEHLRARLWVERNGRDHPAYREQAGWVLDEPPESGYDRIRRSGPFYARLPEQQPRWYEFKKWWSVVRFWLLGK